MERAAERYCLQRGQTLHLHAGQAAAIVIAGGRLSLTQAPQWLGEQLLSSSIALTEGQAHAIDDGGWISLTALAPAEIIALPRRRRMPAWLELPRHMAAALGLWRRLSGRRA